MNSFPLYGLRLVRKNLNRTQVEVASLTNRSLGSVRSLERGAAVSEQDAAAIAKALGTSIAFLRQKPGKQTFIDGCAPADARMDATEL